MYCQTICHGVLYFVYLILQVEVKDGMYLVQSIAIHHTGCRVSFDRSSTEYLSVIILLKCEEGLTQFRYKFIYRYIYIYICQYNKNNIKSSKIVFSTLQGIIMRMHIYITCVFIEKIGKNKFMHI